MPPEPTYATPNPLDASCGWCGYQVSMPRLSAFHQFAVEASGYMTHVVLVGAMYVCPRAQCLRPTLVVFGVQRDHLGTHHDASVLKSYPSGRAEVMKGLTGAIATDRNEAWGCLHAGHFRAAIIMGRAAIQRAVRELGGQGAGLEKEIKSLVAAHKIPPGLAGAAHESRIAGDDAAHPSDLVGEVTREEAEESLEFMDLFLEAAIALPARTAARKAARKPEATT